MNLTELAKRAGIHPDMVRYYEHLGILPPSERTRGGRRAYTEDHVERLVFIRTCRMVGISLQDIGRLLYFRDRPELARDEIVDLLDGHIARINDQLVELERVAEALRSLKGCP